MVKKDLKLTIDEDILQIAKAEIPNLSKLFQDILEYSLDISNKKKYQLLSYKERLEQERVEIDSQILLINKQLYQTQNDEVELKEQKDSLWEKLLGHRVNGMAIPTHMIAESIDLLGFKNVDELDGMLDLCNTYHNSVNAEGKRRIRSEWDFACEKWDEYG